MDFINRLFASHQLPFFYCFRTCIRSGKRRIRAAIHASGRWPDHAGRRIFPKRNVAGCAITVISLQPVYRRIRRRSGARNRSGALWRGARQVIWLGWYRAPVDGASIGGICHLHYGWSKWEGAFLLEGVLASAALLAVVMVGPDNENNEEAQPVSAPMWFLALILF